MSKRAREVIGTPDNMASRITASFALPSDYAPLRMRNEYSTEETALFKVFEEHKNWITGAAVGEQLRDDTHVEIIFQDNLRNRISYTRNPLNTAWSYQWVFRRTNSGVDVTNFAVAGGATELAVPSHAAATGAFKPHGDILFAESDEQFTGLWVDATTAALSNVNVLFSVVPTATSGRIVLMQYTNGTWTEGAVQVITIAIASYNFGISTTAIYALRIEAPNLTTNVSIISSGTCGCWGHLSTPYFVTNGNVIESARSLGHSLLWKNVAAPLNQQGYVTAVQPGKGRFYASFLSFNGTDDIFPVVRDYAGAANTMPLATGIYGYIKPTEEEDVKFRVPFTIQNLPGVTSTFWTFAKTPILKTEYVIFIAQCSNALGRDTLIRTDINGEFETSNQFFNVDKPRAEPSEWRDGMEALASLQQFFENPIHWDKIRHTLGLVASIGGRIASLFGGRAKAVGMPVSMAGDILRGM
jgi:hypothetical protein